MEIFNVWLNEISGSSQLAETNLGYPAVKSVL